MKICKNNCDVFASRTRISKVIKREILKKRLVFGILVATKHPDSVKILIQNVNTMKDANGSNYHLETKTWSELGLDVD